MAHVSDDTAQDIAQAPASKRRRVAVACDACRTRKSRCDGNRPLCSLCRDLGFDCVYTPPTTATNVIVQKDYLHGLEDRVRNLENSLSTVKNDIAGLFTKEDRGAGRVLQPSEYEQSQRVVAGPVPDLTGTEDSVDAMGAITFANEEDSGFFGPSSNIAFLRHLSRAVFQQGYLMSPGAADGGFVSASRPPSPPGHTKERDKRAQVNIYTLPSQDETLKIIGRYFSNTGLLFPYIYAPAFLETYHQMARENFALVRRTWLGLLNMILAMATITAVPDGSKADTRIAESDVFYQRGLGLCGSEILRGATLEVVQFLLLMGQYLQGTQKSIQAWTVHGLAVKGALQLGLHSRNALKSFTNLEQETRKRTWYGCVLLDRTLSMTFGRPAAIPDSYVKLDLPVKHDFEKPTDFVDDETSVLKVAFFNATITLYKHLWNVLDLLYGQNLGCDPPLPITEAVAHIFSMEQHLFAWERSLTQPLQLISTASLNQITQGQLSNCQYFSWKFRVILTLRYLNLRVLLHRPVLVKFIAAGANPERDPQDLKLLQQIGMNSLQICADSAMAIIDIVHQVVTEPSWKQSLLGAWWFSLYYTFNAALVIIGTVWVYCDTSVTGTTMAVQASKAKQYPSRAVAALSKLDEGNRLIDRCRHYLETFDKALNDPETHDVATASFHGLTGNRNVSDNDLTFSPFGMELGEFMMDGDLVGMMDRQEILPEPGTSYPA